MVGIGGVEHPWWTINCVAWQRDHPKWTLGQRYRWALVHVEEIESTESADRMMSGNNENGEALSYRCMWLWGETDYVSSYDMWWCPQLHVDVPGYSNPCRFQLCQTLRGIYLTVTIGTRWRRPNQNKMNSIDHYHAPLTTSRNAHTNICQFPVLRTNKRIIYCMALYSTIRNDVFMIHAAQYYLNIRHFPSCFRGLLH